MHRRIGANKLKKRRESRSPAAIKRKGRIVFSLIAKLLTVAILCLGSAFCAYRLWVWLQTSPRFCVRTIEIRGAVRTEKEEIRRLSRLREGMRMLAIKPAKTEKAVLANCWIRKARVSRRMPDKVIITVEEREPIALVNVGKIYYIDDEGVKLPLFPATYSNLPLVSGISDSAGAMIPRSTLRRIQAFLSAAGAQQSLFKQVSQIDFSDAAYAKIKLENSPLLIEIDDRQCDVQWKRFQELWEVFTNDPEGMPRSINLSYKNLAFAQW